MRYVLLLIAIFYIDMSCAEGFLSRLLHHPVPGGVAVIPLDDGQDLSKVTYNQRQVLVIKEDDVRPIAIVGIPLDAKGKQHLLIENQPIYFELLEKDYPKQHITLPKQKQKYVTPNLEHEKRIARELKHQREAYQHFSDVIPSNLYLDLPVDGRVSAVFGVGRFFNGQKRNAHTGLDLAVPAGTPIKMPANGVVLLTGDYFFNGQTVIVDHGRGLISMFCHMSAIDVEQGQKLKRGDVVGKVGATGRATGPHLHWSVSLNNVRVDPAIFIGKFQE